MPLVKIKEKSCDLIITKTGLLYSLTRETLKPTVLSSVLFDYSSVGYYYTEFKFNKRMFLCYGFLSIIEWPYKEYIFVYPKSSKLNIQLETSL